jgi:hypothetical protein
MYRYVISIDDDILLPPATFAAMLDPRSSASIERVLYPAEQMDLWANVAISSTNGKSASLETDEHFRGPGCAMLTPTLSTGIPTVEMWADDFLTHAERQLLGKCFIDAAKFLPDVVSNLPIGVLRGDYSKSNEGDDHGEVWDAIGWYKALHLAAAPNRVDRGGFLTDHDVTGWLDGPIRSSLGAGVHPIRQNNSCTAVAFDATRAHLAEHFDSTPASIAQGARRHRIETFQAPYLANSAWATTPGMPMSCTLRRLLLLV